MRGVPYFRSMFYRRPRDSVGDESSGVMINYSHVAADRNSRSPPQGRGTGGVAVKFGSRKGKMGKSEDQSLEPVHRAICPDAEDFDVDRQNSDAASFALVTEKSLAPEDLESESMKDSMKRTCRASMGRESSFTDLEMASNHVSDPGVNRLKELESLLSSPPQQNGGRSEGAKSELLPASVDGRSECGSVRHQDTHSTYSGRRGVILSGENSSVGGEGRDFSSRAGIRSNGSPHSDGSFQYDPSKSMYKVGVSSRAMGANKKKSWWKTFLVSLRNVHREAERDSRSSKEGKEKFTQPVWGYVSDVDARLRNRSLSVLNEADSDLEGGSCEVQSPRALVTRTNRLMGHRAMEDGLGRSKSEGCDLAKFIVVGDSPKSEEDGHDISKSECSPEVASDRVDVEDKPASPIAQVDSGVAEEGSGNVGEWIRRTRKMEAIATRKPTSSRVEEWLKTVENDSQEENGLMLEDEGADGEEACPGSPTAPAAAYFENRGSRMHVSGGAKRGDYGGDVDVEAEETAKMIMRAVNPLSTVAHFSGMGLSTAPALGMYTNLKTLNLSANNIVNLPPRCLPKSLHSLDLSRNSIAIVEGLRDLTRLRVLNMSHNRISRIGNGLSTCTSLKELYLAGNRISEVEGLRRLSKLVVLDLSFNKLTTLRALSRVSVNNDSLQALNVLGNAVHSNVGDEQLRRYLTYLCTELLFLNRQPLKQVPSREALGRELKSTYKTTSAKPTARSSGHHSHRKGHGTGMLSKGRVSDRKVSPALLPHEDGHHHRKSHRSARSSGKVDLPFVKGELPKGFVAIPTGADDILNVEQPAPRVVAVLNSMTMARVRSDGALYREDHSSPIAESLRAVQSRMR